MRTISSVLHPVFLETRPTYAYAVVFNGERADVPEYIAVYTSLRYPRSATATPRKPFQYGRYCYAFWGWSYKRGSTVLEAYSADCEGSMWNSWVGGSSQGLRFIVRWIRLSMLIAYICFDAGYRLSTYTGYRETSATTLFGLLSDYLASALPYSIIMTCNFGCSPTYVPCWCHDCSIVGYSDLAVWWISTFSDVIGQCNILDSAIMCFKQAHFWRRLSSIVLVLFICMEVV